MTDRYDDLYSKLSVPALPPCGCYPGQRMATLAHLPGCAQYTVQHDPFIRPCWKIHKLDTLWSVCQVRPETGYHDGHYLGKTWEDAIVWLAVEYGRRRSQRRALEIAMLGKKSHVSERGTTFGQARPTGPSSQARSRSESGGGGAQVASQSRV